MRSNHRISYPSSQKIYVRGKLHDISVGMRRVELADTVTVENGVPRHEKNTPVVVYDTSGDYSDTAELLGTGARGGLEYSIDVIRRNSHYHHERSYEEREARYFALMEMLKEVLEGLTLSAPERKRILRLSCFNWERDGYEACK